MKLGAALVFVILWGTASAHAQAPVRSFSDGKPLNENSANLLDPASSKTQWTREATMKPEGAVSGKVTGNDQQVGFRAMIMKQAIEYNLAGYAKNLPNNVVSFTLQGDADRLDRAVAAVRAGTKKSSNIQVTTEPGTVDRMLDNFTIFAWTSTSRNITAPYNLVFNLRAEGTILSASDVKGVWQSILKSTLKGDDLNKLRGHD